MEINLYVPINWRNFESGNTALEEINLNHEEDYLSYIGQFLKELPNIATKVSELDNDLSFVVNDDMETYVKNQIDSIGNIQTIKGRVDTESELPTENNKVGDTWIVGTIDSEFKSEYVWTSSDEWEELGNVSKVDLSNFYDKAEIDKILDDYLKANNIFSVQYNEELREFQYTLNGTDWITIYSGRTGDNGATFIPSVDDEGNISWSNDKMLPNPPTKNIKGNKGDTGFSPTITAYEDTDTTYKLQITNEDSTFLTPNLRGKNGDGSGDMEKSVYDPNDDGIVSQADKVTHKLSITVDHVNKLYDGSEDVNIDITLPSGDMIKSIYDTNDDGVVDEASKVTNALTINLNGVTTTYNGSQVREVDIETRDILSSITILTTDWVDKTYTYSVPSYDATTQYCFVSPATYESSKAWGSSEIFATDGDNNSIVFTCHSDIPTEDIVVDIKVGAMK